MGSQSIERPPNREKGARKHLTTARLVHILPLSKDDLSTPRVIRRKVSHGVIFCPESWLLNPPLSVSSPSLTAKTCFTRRNLLSVIHFPNYDVRALAAAICVTRGWQLDDVRFYTGIPDVSDNAFWSHFWTAKLAQMGRDNITVYSRPLRYRNQTVRLPDGRRIRYWSVQRRALTFG